MTTPRPWSVYRPGPLVQQAPDVWSVDDEVPDLRGARRRMVVVRKRDGSLVFFNAIPVPDDTLTALRALGSPAALIVPNGFHALDAHAFCEKLQLTAFAPGVALEGLKARAGLSCRPIGELKLDDDMEVFQVDGFKTEEVVLVAKDTLIVADLVTNAPHEPGLSGWLMKLVGFTGPQPRLPKPVRMRVGRSMPKVRALLEKLADRPGLARLIPSHGAVVEADVPAALRNVAATL